RRLSLWNSSFLSWGSFFYWNDVFGYRLGSSPLLRPFGYRLGSLKTLLLTKQGFLFFCVSDGSGNPLWSEAQQR
ncbi:MAG: hypothetical protein QE264_05735, partial [Flavobacterium sp.]|nr:hypothetical protein [Flavobacterium sp.]